MQKDGDDCRMFGVEKFRTCAGKPNCFLGSRLNHSAKSSMIYSDLPGSTLFNALFTPQYFDFLVFMGALWKLTRPHVCPLIKSRVIPLSFSSIEWLLHAPGCAIPCGSPLPLDRRSLLLGRAHRLEIAEGQRLVEAGYEHRRRR